MARLLITILSISLLSTTSYRQLTKGNLILGGSFSLSSNTQEGQINNYNVNETKNSGISITPSAGIFLTDNLVAGITTGYNFVRTENFIIGNQKDINKNSGFNISPFVRYYKSLAKSLVYLVIWEYSILV